MPVAGTEELVGGRNWGQLKAKAKPGSAGSTLAIFKVSAFEQPWKLGSMMCNRVCNTHRSTGTGSEIFS